MNLEDLTVPVLKKLIRAYNLHTVIKGYSTMNKIDLIKNIKKHFSISDNNLHYKEHNNLNVSEELKYKQVRKAKATTTEVKKEIKKVVKEVKKELAPEIKKQLKVIKDKKKFDKNLKEKVKEQKKQAEKVIIKEVKKIVKKAPEKTVEEAVKEVVLQKPVVLQNEPLKQIRKVVKKSADGTRYVPEKKNNEKEVVSPKEKDYVVDNEITKKLGEFITYNFERPYLDYIKKYLNELIDKYGNGTKYYTQIFSSYFLVKKIRHDVFLIEKYLQMPNGKFNLSKTKRILV
jgi:hypothetical protein